MTPEIKKTEARERILKLRQEINRHRYLYHVLDKEEISESALDSLKHELWQLEQKFPDLITPDSPTRRIGGRPLDKFQKVKHGKPVLSLQDVFSLEEARQWEERNVKILKETVKGYYCELKLDGLSVVLTYKQGVFVRGTTRGDGWIGEDVTQNLKTMESIPLRLRSEAVKNSPPVIEVRGEIVMTKKNFERLNGAQKKSGQPLFANPRNVAAGSVRQLDPAITASRRLDCFVFELITDLGQRTHEKSHEMLAGLGFKTSSYNEAAADMDAVGRYLRQWEEKRKVLPFNTDGAVIVVNDVAQERRLGYVGKAERWMAAYKFPAEQATTKVRAITVQVGRTGALTPVAELEPVLVAGSTVKRATLHNEDEIKRLDIRVGDTVIIQKAGDIIPDVVQVLKKLRTGRETRFAFPDKCPICGSKVIRRTGEVAHYCANKRCFAQQLRQLIHAVGSSGFDIDGLGVKIVEQLLLSGLVRSLGDIFRLTAGDLKPLERFAERSADNLVRAIDAAKNVSLNKFINSLGIRHVGEETAHVLSQEFKSIAALRRARRQELEALPDIGPKVAASIVEWFADKHQQAMLDELLSAGIRFEKVPSLKVGKLQRQTFVLTGTLSQTREEIADRIRAAGGKVSGSVSRSTDYVVVGDNPGSKLSDAVRLGVATVSEDELRKLW